MIEPFAILGMISITMLPIILIALIIEKFVWKIED